MIKLKNKNIGKGEPVYIIAEVGSNFCTLDDCKSSIAMAKACGADAVKFQLYDEKALYGFNAGQLKGKLPKEWLPILKEKADACGIDFMCSAFSVEYLYEVNKYVDMHKVASAECTHVRILEALKEINKPVLLSTGGHFISDILMSLEILVGTPTIPMYCISSYPVRSISMSPLKEMQDKLRMDIGFSDHTVDAITIPIIAKQLGAVVIEKHFTIIPNIETPDRPHSLLPEEFKVMSTLLKEGKLYNDISRKSEQGMFEMHNRRLIATRDIFPGEQFIENENFGIYRSLIPDTKALSPFHVYSLNGLYAQSAIKKGHGIPPSELMRIV